jgi:hypothetical protein
MDIIFNSPRIGCLSQNINTFPFNYPRILLRGKTLINLIHYLYLHFPSRLLLIWEKANQHEFILALEDVKKMLYIYIYIYKHGFASLNLGFE